MDEQVQLAPDAGARPLRLGRCEVLIGTCSWADPSFVQAGQFYPRGVGGDPQKRLRFYATVFPTVEVDATYHALQPASRAAQWVRWTPEHFVFNVKAFALFTGHETNPQRLPREIFALLPGKLRELEQVSAGMLPEEIVTACWDYFAAFIDEFRKAGKLGHVLLQFPKGQGYTPALFEHLDRWQPYLQWWPVAVEIRHRSWLEGAAREAFLAYLRRRGYAYVIPDLAPIGYLPRHDLEVTAPWSVVRFHGRNTAMLERRAPTNRVYDYLYSEDELRRWAGRARQLSAQVERLYLLFNNHYRGQSARNARQLASLLEQ